MIIHTLKIIGDLADNILNEGTQTKRLCHDCIRDYIDIAHGLFPIYVNDAAVCEQLFAFFHIVLDVLKTQVTTLPQYSKCSKTERPKMGKRRNRNKILYHFW